MEKLTFRVWDSLREQFVKQITKFYFDKDGNINLVAYLDEHTKPMSEQDEVLTDSFAINQWTGLKDRNNKRIYEGDIVKSTQSKAILVVRMGYYDDKMASQHGLICVWLEVVNNAKPYGFSKCAFPKRSAEVVEVIGNIYEYTK